MYDVNRDTEWKQVASSNVEAVCYFHASDGRGVIGVMYMARGNTPRAIYHYTHNSPVGSDRRVYEAMLRSPSLGKFRHAYLTPQNGYLVDGPLNS
jgi:hypothetical protein